MGKSYGPPAPDEVRNRITHARDIIGRALESIHDLEACPHYCRQARVDLGIAQRAAPSPSLQEAFSLLERAEKQREQHRTNLAKSTLAAAWCTLKGTE